MRLTLIAATLLLFPLSLRAAEESKPNTLTPKEIAEGWLLLFDGETTFGWKADSGWSATEGQLVAKDKAAPLVSTSRFGPCELRFDYQLRGAGKPKVRFGGGADRARETAVDLGELKFDGSMTLEVSITEEGGDQVSKWTFRSSDTTGTGDARVSKARADGAIAFEGGLALRNIKLKPLGLKPIFNGKDLSGWKEFPGKKSKFTVNDKGELNVKDGPGDLQTTGKYDDFLLQLECISNGKHLNSGIFFRCIADQYQNGYEAQIQNGFKDGDRTKPADFGTGAIYRRIAARKVVANDHEWFTMTVLAQGRHIATWVNGYQTVDWTDDRPPDENPRKGSKTGKGHLSIQGHDPTTDLSFRNLRIMELPRSEKK